jgi:uncharacterized protein YjgD (DUF1641 family)
MESEVKQDILSVLRKALNILNSENPDISALKRVSNETNHNASIFQDEHSVSVAVLIYSISKIYDRLKDRVNFSRVSNLISSSISFLEKDDTENFHKSISKIFSIISDIDKKFRFYVQEVINQASIRKGSKIYSNGLSASKTAEILGISLWELHDYISATNIVESDSDISSVRDRLKFTRGLFK